MEQKHRKGLWSEMAGMPTNVLDSSGLRVARCDFDGDFNHPEAIANAKRIIECVNALDGISNGELRKIDKKALRKFFDDQLFEQSNKEDQ